MLSTLGYIIMQAPVEAVAGADPDKKITLFGLIFSGGWVMVPIFLLFFAAVFLGIYKYLNIKRNGHIDNMMLGTVINHVTKGNIESGRELCKHSPTFLARILERGLIRLGSPMQEVESGMESSSRASIASMEKNLGILAAIATLAPMFGFLGTVIGMISVFTGIASSEGAPDISSIADGMYVKMVTSAAGLIVGIIAHIINTYLNNMIDNTVARLEDASNEFVDVLYKPHHEVQKA
jgi:biopolymer transport protein ExbB